jgi:hypothetical protein
MNMPICPCCQREITFLLHGVNCNLIVKAGFNLDLGRRGLPRSFYVGFADRDHPLIRPEIFDVITSWYSCPICFGEIVAESLVADSLGSRVDQAAERFLRGVENYLEDGGLSV